MDQKRVDDVLYEYIVKFEDTPPLLYGCDYHDEAVLAIIENAINRRGNENRYCVQLGRIF